MTNIDNLNSLDIILNNIFDNDNILCDEVLNTITNMKKELILNQHPYKITQNKDGRFSTYVYDKDKQSNRRKIVKPTKEALLNALIEYYDVSEQKEKKCLRNIYPEWLDYKSLHTDSSAYIKTIDELWKKYYLDDSIIDIPLSQLDKYTLDVWAHNLVRNNNMTTKKYYNTTIIMRQALAYALDRNIITKNPFELVHIDKKLFNRPKKKKSDTQVFLVDEQSKIEIEAYKDFTETSNSACLAIPFAFQTGLRISEIVALRWTDINEEKENSIHIQRMEIKQFHRIDDCTWTKPIRTVIDRTKTDVGNRNVYLTESAKKILKTIWEHNKENNYGNSDYIFKNKNGRITSTALDCRIRKYCSRINISEKGMHKIRKTYISTLIDSENININYIREQVGHADERTTYGNYCFNRKTKDLTESEMEKALSKYSI